MTATAARTTPTRGRTASSCWVVRAATRRRRYTFTLPSATIYSSVRASAYGKSMSGYGKGYIGIRNYSTDNLDAFKYVGYSTDWYGNSVGRCIGLRHQRPQGPAVGVCRQ